MKEKYYQFNAQDLNLKQWKIVEDYIFKNAKFIETENYSFNNDEGLKNEVKIVSKSFTPINHYSYKNNIIYRFKYTSEIHNDLVQVMKPLKSLSTTMQGYWFLYGTPVFFNEKECILWSRIGELIILLKIEEFNEFCNLGFNLIEYSEREKLVNL